jgi:hypothetical protein
MADVCMAYSRHEFLHVTRVAEAVSFFAPGLRGYGTHSHERNFANAEWTRDNAHTVHHHC